MIFLRSHGALWKIKQLRVAEIGLKSKLSVFEYYEADSKSRIHFQDKNLLAGLVLIFIWQVRIQRGGQGVRTPPGKSQVIWVSIGNEQLDPSWKNLDPPWKMLDPLWNLEK